MADLSHCQPNQLARRAWLWRWGSLLVLSPIAVGLGALLTPVAAVAMVPIWALCRRAGALAHAGATGELAALHAFKALPDDHIVFNQVRLPCPAAYDGFLEADYVVVAPHRVAVVEVKNNPGEIQAAVKGASWNIVRHSKMATMRSPSLQVMRHVAALGGWLRTHGAPSVWVEPAVYFSHPGASYRHTPQTADSKVSLVGPDELAAYFAFRQPTDRRIDQKAVIAALEALREWERARAAGHAPPLPNPTASMPRAVPAPFVPEREPVFSSTPPAPAPSSVPARRPRMR